MATSMVCNEKQEGSAVADLEDMDEKGGPLQLNLSENTNESNKDPETENIEPKTETSSPKKGKRDEHKKRREDKSIDHVLQALNSLNTTEEKLAALCKKYADILEENRKLQNALKQSEKRSHLLNKEKEQLQTEHSKAVLTRSRLEGLCRELQRQNKVVKDESLLRIREEEEKRKEVSSKFQTTLNEISTLLQQNNEKNAKLKEENVEMAQKLKSLCEQYEIREQHVEKVLKHKELESQLAEAKLAKANVELSEEKEKFLKEKQTLLLELTEYQKRCQELQSTEVTLRSQLGLYTEKYDEFQKALTKSNEIFGGFKEEMEKMSKKIKKLEKETSSWKQRWENSNRALLEMAEDKQKRDGEMTVAMKQITQLEKLCRALQSERTVLQSQLKAVDNLGGRDVPAPKASCMEDEPTPDTGEGILPEAESDQKETLPDTKDYNTIGNDKEANTEEELKGNAKEMEDKLHDEVHESIQAQSQDAEITDISESTLESESMMESLSASQLEEKLCNDREKSEKEHGKEARMDVEKPESKEGKEDINKRKRQTRSSQNPDS